MITNVNKPSRKYAPSKSKEELVETLLEEHPKWMSRVMVRVDDHCKLDTVKNKKLKTGITLEKAMKLILLQDYNYAIEMMKKDKEAPLSETNITNDPDEFIAGYNNAADEISVLKREYIPGMKHNKNLILWRDIKFPIS